MLWHQGWNRTPGTQTDCRGELVLDTVVVDTLDGEYLSRFDELLHAEVRWQLETMAFYHPNLRSSKACKMLWRARSMMAPAPFFAFAVRGRGLLSLMTSVLWLVG